MSTVIHRSPARARSAAGAAEYPQREIVHLIEKNNYAPSDSDLYQLTRATRSGWTNWVIDTGSENQLSVALDPPLTMYRQGLPLRVLIKQNNSGPTVIRVNGLENRPVTRADGAQLEANDLRTGMIALLVDDGTKFQVVNLQGAAAGASTSYFIDIPYAQDTDAAPNNITGTYSDLPTNPVFVSGDLILIKINGRNTGTVSFKVNALAGVPIVRTDGQPIQAYDLDHNEILLLVYNVDRWQCLRLVRSQCMFKLNANLTLYVRSLDGDDINGDGSENVAGKAFKTIQRAVNYVKFSFFIAGRTVIIQLGHPGLYTGQVVVTDLPGKLVIRGAGAPLVPGGPNPLPSTAEINSYVVQGPVGPKYHGQVLAVSGSGIDVTVQNITFSVVEQSSHFTECDYNAFLTVDNCNYSGSPTSGSCIACTSASVIVLNNIHIYSNCTYVLHATERGAIIVGAWYSNFQLHGITYLNGGAFVGSLVGAVVSLYYNHVNWGGSAVGYRHICALNSTLYSAIGGAQWLPGSVDGVTDYSSIYY